MRLLPEGRIQPEPGASHMLNPRQRLLLGGWGQQPGHTVFSGVERVSEQEARLALQAFPFCVR